MKNKQIIRLLTPSWLVNVLGVAAGIIVTAVIIVLANYQSSSLRLQVMDLQARSVVDQQQGLYANITLDQKQTSLIGSLPLLLTWACVGLIVYFLAVSFVQSAGRFAESRQTMKYVNASPAAVRRQALQSMCIRLVAAVGWVLFTKLTVSVITPYVLASAAVASTQFSITTALYAAMSALIVYAAIVVHVIFLRLILLKPRIFSR